MELDTRIVEYANVINNDAHALLTEDSHLSAEQRDHVSKIPMFTDKLIFYYESYSGEIANESEMDSRATLISAMFHEVRSMVTGIQTRCYLIEMDKNSPVRSENDAQTLFHIKEYCELIYEEAEKSEKKHI